MNVPDTGHPITPPTPTTTLDGSGTRILQRTKELLDCEDAHAIRHDDGFTWWLDRRAQRFSISGLHEAGGTRYRTLSFTTDFVKGVSRRTASVDSLIELLHSGGEMTNAALVGDKLVQRGRIAIYEDSPDEEVENRLKMFTHRAILANLICGAHGPRVAAGLTADGAGSPNVTADDTVHPTTGPRPHPHPLHDALDRVFVARGNEPLPEPCRPDLVECFVDLVKAGNKVFIKPDMSEYFLPGTQRGIEYRVSLDLSERNAMLGGGMFVRITLTLPKTIAEKADFTLPQLLNDLEWGSPDPLMQCGGWALLAPDLQPGPNPLQPTRERLPIDKTSLLYGAFFPNASMTAGLAMDATLDALARVGRTARWLQPDWPD